MEKDTGEGKQNESNTEVQEAHKRGRQRKKQLYNSILQQMEFYFSDSNLSKDRFMSQLIQENPVVDLSVFLKFNKIRKLTTNPVDIRKALRNSTVIQLSDDGNSVSRTEPIKEKANVDECTIYVERLKADATHDWLTSVFSEFGTVVYVSIPKYKNTNAIKGFAFVEFDKEGEAQKALDYFEGIGCKMPSNVEPELLCSVATFDQEGQATESANKRKFDEEKEDDTKVKKIKTDAPEAIEFEDTENKKKKKKKEHKKKNYMKELGLQVLSKKEWKKMRNRYLDMQRKKMKEFKRHLNKIKFSQPNYEEKGKKQELTEEKTENTSKIEFMEGVIVKLKLEEQISDLKKFKGELKGCNDIKYVDIPNPGSEEIFIRFASNVSAKTYCDQESPHQKIILTGDEEKLYWDKLMQDREDKFKKTNNKQRGRDKLLKKANKILANHIKFDE